MQLDRFQLVLRPRNGWETVDLGLLLTRRWAKPVFGLWAALWLPAAALAFGLLYRWPGYAGLLLWWLKPVFDRAYLHVLSGAVFDVSPGVRSTLRDWHRWLRGSGVIAALLWRRLSLARTLLAPIWQLEGQRGKAFRLRARVVARYARGNAIAAGLALIHAGAALYFALLGLIDLLLPSDAGISVWQAFRGTQHSPWGLWALALAAAAIDSLLEPFFTGIGFALYLQRRTTLEGWDLELAFRRLGQRLAHAGAAVAMALMLILLPFVPRPAEAAPATDPQQTLQEVLRDPALGHYESDSGWRPKRPRAAEARDAGDHPVLEAIARWLAEYGRLLVWLFGAALIVFAILRLAPRLLDWRGMPRRAPAPLPDVVFGLDVRPAQLPDDVAAAARAALARGAVREALSLLYRGALVHWLSRGLEIQPGDTEGDCVRRVHHRHGGDAAQTFDRLVTLWQRAAYAAAPPTAADVAPLLDDWGRHFRPGAEVI